MKKNRLILTITVMFMLAFALPVLAAIPAPPANQNIGIDDTVFGEFAEADCRLCHEDPLITEPTSIPDRHHLLYNGTTYQCLTCHTEEVIDGIITFVAERDCVECHESSPHHQTSWAQSGDCVHCHGTLVDNPTGCKQLECVVASSSAGTTRGVSLGISCTTEGTTGSECDTAGVDGGPVKICRDTTDLCADNSDCPAGSCSVTATTSCYANADCPTGETCVGAQPCSLAAYCGMYGGEATCDDGHDIPTYAPSLVTPARSGHDHVCELSGNCSVTTTDACSTDGDCEDGETCEGLEACQYDTDCGVDTLCLQEHEEGLVGGCTYCHSADPNEPGTLDPASGVWVRDNHDTHHGAGVHSGHSERCAWCHSAGYPHTVAGELPNHIRTCENCHGYESLHNIQTDSDASGNIGTIVVGGENFGYGHVGNDNDCWGCHGFSAAAAAATGSGPLTPFLSGSDALGATSGYDTTLTLIGATLTNLVGTYQWTSDITMTGASGSAVTLTPDSVNSSQMSVTIPAATAPGNYALRAVKGTSAASNPIVISVTPEVAIAAFSCNKKKSVLSVRGSGFGEKPAGTDDYINVQVNGQSVDVISWSDTRIRASVSECSSNAAITVNALMGSATSGDSGKPAKPCKGKKCN